MFGDTIETPRELFTHKLGAALTMEQTVLGMLAELEQATRRAELKEKFRHHAGETRQQIQNLERAFRAIGAEVDDKPCPAIEGLEKEGQTLIKQTDEQLVDVVLHGAERNAVWLGEGPAAPGFHRVPCPAGGSIRAAFASPRLPRRGEIADLEPGKDLLGWKVVRGADVSLPSGRLLVTGGEYLGADQKPADLGVEPGLYPWFLILAKRPRFAEPIFAQLVLDPTSRPVRWADDRRFGWVTDGGIGFIGS